MTSRWLPDSALTTYFGKPAFHPYGHANTNPSNGGAVYGQYMKTFNVNPHSGGNKPEFSQVHGRTLLGGTVQVRAPGSRSPKKRPISMTRKPIPPRIAPQKKQIPKEELVADLKARNSVRPQTFKEAQARELVILPPTFTEKNLQTKKLPPGMAQKLLPEKGEITESQAQKRGLKKKGIDLEAARETKRSNEQSARFSDKNTIDSQGDQMDHRRDEDLLHHSQSRQSVPAAQDLTDRD